VEDEARGRDRVGPGEHDREAALGRAVEARRAQLLDGLGGAAGERDEQRAVLLSTAPSSSTSGTAPARVCRANQPRPSWRAVVMRPTQRRSTARSHASTSALVVSSGKRSTTSATWTPAQSSTGAYHSRRSQSKRRPGMRRTSATTCGS